MLNHFRTLLLNLGYAQESEQIPREFAALTLPAELGQIRDILYPSGSSRYFRIALAHSYLNIVQGAGLQSYVTESDTRISYDLSDSQFFKLNRTSSVKASSIYFPLFVSGELTNNIANRYHYEAIKITQNGSYAEVFVYSIPNGVYYSTTGAYPEGEQQPIELGLLDTVTNVIPIGNTGLSFSIGLGGDFTATGNKTWSFLCETPFNFYPLTTFEELDKINTLKTLLKYSPNQELEDIYTTSTSRLIKLAVLLVLYVQAINSLL